MCDKRNLFDDDSDGSEDNLSLTINKDYAQRYEEWREAEVKRKLEDKYANNSESLLSSSSDDDEDDPEELQQVVNKDFFEVISSLKTKDPKIYNPEVQFFKNEKSKGGLDPLEKQQKKKKDGDKPIFLRDYERKLITERGGQLSDDESDTEEKDKRALSPTYVEEQKRLKESFKKALQDDNSDEESTLLKKKTKTKAEELQEEEEYIQWLKGEKKDLANKETEESLKPLQNLWNDPKLDEGEKFLRDYVLNKRYLEKDSEPIDTENVSDEDYQDEYMDQFERKYNFRFEEPDRDFLKRYPRTMEQSLRKKDTRRKEKREAVKQRKEEEKNRKREELKVLKALKRKEILKKIEKIKEITGNEELGLNPEELEEDFDPEAHDKKMRELFNDDYYGGADDAEDEDGLNLPPLDEDLLDDDNINWDDWDGTDRAVKEIPAEGALNNADFDNFESEGYCEDEEFNMDCDYDPATEALKREEKAAGRRSAREKRKLKRQSRFGRLVRKEKPTFDPRDKTFDQYVDEYYGMDYEDLIGDIPCRFKYKSVPANSFGLTIDEILAADDKELNQWASIKKAYTIRSEQVERYEAKVYAQKGQNEELKRKILPSLYKHEMEEEDVREDKKKKKKKRKQIDVTQIGTDFNNSVGQPSVQASQNETCSYEAKGKKRKAHEQIDSGEHFESPDNSNQDSNKKKKKRKCEADDLGGSSNEVKVDNHISDSDSPGELAKKKKKKKTLSSDDSSANHINTTTSKNLVKQMKTSLKSKANNGKQKDGDKNHSSAPKKARKDGKQSMSMKKTKMWKKDGKRNQSEIDISDERLKAYGLHPKRFKNKLKYGAK